MKGKGSRSQQRIMQSQTSLLMQFAIRISHFALLFHRLCVCFKSNQSVFILLHIFTLHYMARVFGLCWLSCECNCVCASRPAIIYDSPNWWVHQRNIEITFISFEQCAAFRWRSNVNDSCQWNSHSAGNTFLPPKARCKNDKVHGISEHQAK